MSTSYGTATLAFGYTYNAAGVFGAVNPVKGPFYGSNMVTITGTGIGNNDITSVTLGGIEATILTQTSASVTVMAGATTVAGSGNGMVVIMSTSIGTTQSGSNAYLYNAAGIFTSAVPNSGPSTGSTVVTITGTGIGSGSDINTVLLNGISATLGAQTADTVTVTSNAGSGRGNVTVMSTSVGTTVGINAWTYPAAGTISLVSPNNGPAAGGNLVLIVGVGLGSGSDITSVTLNGVAATIVNQTADYVNVRPGAGTPGHSGAIVIISTTVGVTSSGSTIVYLYNTLLVVSQLSFSSGPLDGNQLLAVSGTGFGGDVTSVTVAGIEAAVTSQTVTSVMVSTGAATTPVSGAVTVTSTSHGVGSSGANAYTYNPKPTFTEVVPSVGPFAGGQTVTLTGTGLGYNGDITSLVIGSAAAQIVTQSTTSVVFMTGQPASAGTASIFVSSPTAGYLTASNAYTYNPAGVIDSVTPASGPLEGDDIITIVGTNLGSGSDITYVSLAGVVVAQIMTQTATSVTVKSAATSSPMVSGAVVLNSTTFGSTTKSGQFSYNPLGQISTVSPVSGPLAGGNLVTITGTGIGSGNDITTVLLDDVVAQIQPTGQTNSQVVVLAGASPVAGIGNVTVVSTSIGTSSRSGLYTYNNLPQITSVSPDDGPLAGGNLVEIFGAYLFTSIDNAAAITVKLAGVLATEVSTSGSGTSTVITVRAATSVTAVSGNVSVSAVSVGTATSASNVVYTYNPAGVITSVQPTNGQANGGTIVTIFGSHLGGNDITNVVIGLTPASLQSQAPDGSYVVVSTGVAASGQLFGTPLIVSIGSPSFGNTASSTGLFTYNAASLVQSVTPTNGPLSGNNMVTVSGSSLGNGTDITSVTFGGISQPITSQTATSVVVTAAAVATAGSVAVMVKSENFGSSSGSVNYVFNVAPSISTVTPNSIPAAGDVTVTIQGTVLGANDITSVTLNGVPVSQIKTQTSTSVTVQAAAAAAGTGAVVVMSTSFGTATKTAAFTYNPTGTVTSLTPHDGPSSGNNVVVIAGSGLVGSSETPSVTFGGLAAVVVSSNATMIVVTMPAAPAAGIAQATVAVVSSVVGIATITPGVFYTFNAAGNATSVVPANGPLAGHNTVTILGSNLNSGSQSDVTSVMFGTMSATVQSVTSTAVVVTAPAATNDGVVNVQIGSVSFGVTTGVQLYTFNPAGSISQLQPTSGPLSGGTHVVITGVNLANNDVTSVTLAGISATIVGAYTSTAITVSSGVATTTTANVAVVVSTSFGTTTSTVQFSYNSPGQISSCAPNSGPLAGHYNVTVNGQGIGSGSDITSVTFNGVAATILGQTADSVTVFAPASTVAGPAVVRVASVSIGIGSKNTVFTYNPTPMITNAIPNNGPLAGGLSVIVNGTNLCSGQMSDVTAVYLAGVQATVTAVSVNQITVTSAATATAMTGSVMVKSVAYGDSQMAAAFTYNPRAVLTSVTPNVVATTSGALVTICGTNLIGQTTSITLAGVAVTSAISTVGNCVTALAGVASAATSGSVTLNGPSYGTTTGLTFRYRLQSSVGTVTPNNGPYSGLNNVTISGNNLGSGSDITSVQFVFGTTAVNAVILGQTSSMVMVTVPAPTTAAGGVVATVTVMSTSQGSATLSNAYTYNAAGQISSTIPSPAVGPLGGLNTITIMGTGLGGSDITSVTLASVPAIILAQTANSVTVKAGSSVTPVNGAIVVMSTRFGTTSFSGAFSYLARGAVTSITPNTGFSLGNFVVTITGSNLALSNEAGVTVSISGQSAMVTSITNVAATPVANGYVTTIIATATGCTAQSCMSAGAVAVSSPTLGAVSANNLFTYQYSPIGAGVTFPGVTGGAYAFATASICDSSATITVTGVRGLSTTVTSVNSGAVVFPTAQPNANLITFSAGSTGAFNVVVQNPAGTSVQNITLSFTASTPASTAVPNSGAQVAGSVCSPSESVNYYQTSIAPGNSATFTLTTSGNGNAVLYVSSSPSITGAQFSMATTNNNAQITVSANNAGYFIGTYFLIVQSTDSNTVNYQLAVSTFAGSNPAVQSALLQPSGVALVVTFNMDIQLSSGTASSQCSQYFATSTVTLLGTGAVCVLNSNNIAVTLGSAATIAPSSTPGQVQLLTSSGSTLSSVLVSASNPTNGAFGGPYAVGINGVPIAPVAILQGPSQIASCDQLVLTSASYGNAGRNFASQTWVLSTTNVPNAADILSVISAANANGGSSLTIAGNLLAVGTAYKFQLSVSNYLSTTSASATLSVTSTSANIPTVTIASTAVVSATNPSPLIVAPADGQGFFVTGAATFPSCVTASSVTFAWSISPAMSLDSVTNSSSTLFVRPNSLVPNAMYTLTLTAFATGGASTSASVSLRGPTPTVFAALAGGSQFAVASGASFSLNAGLSSGTNNLPLTYSWSCVIQGTTTACPAQTQLSNVSTSAVQVNGIAVTTNTFYVFTVNVGLQSFSAAQQSASVVVNVQAVSSLPVIQILSSFPGGIVDTTSQLAILASVTGATNTTWSATGDVFSNAGAVSTPLSNSYNLVINPFVLVSGQVYTFTLTAFASGGVSTSATLTVTGAQVPAGGSCIASPSTGVALSQAFSVVCTNWAGQVLPLSYTFAYAAAGSPVETALGAMQSTGSTSAFLPSPNSASNDVTLIAYISDARGSTTRYVAGSVTVTQPVVTSAQNAVDLVTSAINSQLQSATQVGNAAAVSQIATAASTILNQQASSVSTSGARASLMASVQIAANTIAATAITALQQTQAVAQIVAAPTQLTPAIQQQAVAVVQQLLQSTQNQGVLPALPNAVASVVSNVLQSSPTTPLSQATSDSVVRTVSALAQNQLNNLVCGQAANNATAPGFVNIAQLVPVNNNNGPLTVYGGSAQSASFQVPSGVISQFATAGQQCVGLQYTGWGYNPFAYAPLSSNVTSNIATLTLRNQFGQAISGQQLSSNITITVPTQPLNSQQLPVLSYFDLTTNTWRSDGCSIVEVQALQVVGQCNHLTDFAVLATAVPVPAPAYRNYGFVAAIIIPLALLIAVGAGYFYYKNARKNTNWVRRTTLKQSLLDDTSTGGQELPVRVSAPRDSSTTPAGGYNTLV
eukprot:TRINITY_DN146_c0_g2_i1.p1 TRINITY_DN146_c0_g2~~TRINITY_DN146_c0_g2_i1.p1  ORF type:complete len:3536 (-),score=1053.92 TRINITY_DN146_c0_g2_i1:83-9331(-)